jgi:GntR family transcriptional regulator of arabinose operon
MAVGVKNKQEYSQEETAPRLRYEQARRVVEDYIRTHRLQPGDRLPTEEALRREFGWSRVTITRALNELAWEGRLKRIQGSGTYVAEPEPGRAVSSEGRGAFRILVGCPPFISQKTAPQDDYCAPLFAGIREEAARQNLDIVYDTSVGVPTVDSLEGRGVTGVLALSWRLDDLPRIAALHAANIPVVGLALRSRPSPLPLVCTDNFGGVRDAVRSLQEAGHRRIAYTTINIHNSDVFERLSGFQFQMAQAGLPVDPAYLNVSSWRRDVPFLEAWWTSMNPRPTALLMDGTDAPALLAALQRQGVRIPDDLSVIVIDEVQALRYHLPTLTVLRQPTFELGQRGLAKLIGILNGTDEGAPEVLPTELIPGESVRPPSD